MSIDLKADVRIVEISIGSVGFATVRMTARSKPAAQRLRSVMKACGGEWLAHHRRWRVHNSRLREVRRELAIAHFSVRNLCGCSAVATRWSGHDVWMTYGGRHVNVGPTYRCTAHDPHNKWFSLDICTHCGGPINRRGPLWLHDNATSWYAGQELNHDVALPKERA